MTETQRTSMKDETAAITSSRIPRDKGYSWVIMFASMIIGAINAGTEKSYGLFFIKFLELFKSSVSATALTTAVMNVTHCVFSLFVMTYLIDKASVRTLAFIGILLCGLGYGLSSVAPTLEFLIFSQSFLVGSGTAFYGSPILVLLSHYFDKRKGLANAVYFAGFALGGMVLPPLYRFVLDEYGIRGGLVITSGIILNSLVSVVLLRPQTFYKVSTKIIKEDQTIAVNARSNETRETQNIACNVEKPDTSEDDTEQSFSLDNDALKYHASVLSVSNPLLCNINGLGDIPISSRQRSFSHCVAKSTHGIHGLPTSDNVVDRIAKSDIIRYTSESNMSCLSLSDITKYKSDENTIGSKNRFLSMLYRLEAGLLRNKLYLLFLAIYSFANIAVATAPIYLATLAADQSLSSTDIATCLSLNNIADFIGRITAGSLADTKWIAPGRIVFLSQLVVGISAQFTSFYTTTWILMTFSTVYGFTSGMVAALFPPMMITITGTQNYARGLALFAVIVGVFNASNVPILGYLKDATGSYHATFHYTGCCSFIALVLLLIFEYFNTHDP